MPTKIEKRRKYQRAYYERSKKQKMFQLSEKKSLSETLQSAVGDTSPGKKNYAINETTGANTTSCIVQATVKNKSRLKKITAESASRRKAYYKRYYELNKEKIKHVKQTKYAENASFKKCKRINSTDDTFSVKNCMQLNNDPVLPEILVENPLEFNQINADKVSLAGKIIDKSLEPTVFYTPIDDKVANTNLSCDMLCVCLEFEIDEDNT